MCEGDHWEHVALHWGRFCFSGMQWHAMVCNLALTAQHECSEWGRINRPTMAWAVCRCLLAIPGADSHHYRKWDLHTHKGMLTAFPPKHHCHKTTAPCRNHLWLGSATCYGSRGCVSVWCPLQVSPCNTKSSKNCGVTDLILMACNGS